MQVSVILPTYNERDNIVGLIAALQENLIEGGWQSEIVVVDDNSPDGTAQAAREFATQAQVEVRVIERKQERGLASAIRHGIMNSCGEHLVVMDTDFNHDPTIVPQFVSQLRFYDLIIGSRFILGGGMEDRRRYWNSWLFNRFIRVLLNQPIHDNLSGFFSIRRETLLALPVETIFRGYGEYFIRLTYLARSTGMRILEIPVYYRLRRFGQSKSQFIPMIRDYTLAAVNVRFSNRRSRSH